MAIVRVLWEEALGCQSVAFESHCCDSMEKRDITEEEILQVLRSPDVKTGLHADLNRNRFRKYLNGRKIDVVFEQDPTQIVVITVVCG